MITKLNPSKFKVDFKEYDRETAVYLAYLSKLAYFDETTINEIIMELTNVYQKHHVEFMEDSKSGTQLIFFGNSEYVILAFRGTEFFKEIKDIILDIKLFRYYQQRGYSNLPAGHGGFRRGLMNLMDHHDIFARLKAFISLCNPENPDLPVYTTGHSLGAALATLIIEPLNYQGFNFQGCYNFAPPLAISFTDAKKLETKYHDVMYDVVNYLDYVPRAGRMNRRNLKHIGKFYRICKNGILNREPEKRNGYYVSHPWSTKFKLYKYHKIDGYIEGLEGNENTNEQIAIRYQNNARCF